MLTDLIDEIVRELTETNKEKLKIKDCLTAKKQKTVFAVNTLPAKKAGV
jgi:hypothetical protein